MALSCGIVGLPNVGKSTIFNALTRSAQALAANYPFATIDPNVGEVAVPDPRLGVLQQIVTRRASCRQPCGSSTLPASCGARAAAKGSATLFSATSAKRTRSPWWCDAFTTTKSRTLRARSTRAATAKSLRSNWRSPIWRRCRSGCRSSSAKSAPIQSCASTLPQRSG